MISFIAHLNLARTLATGKDTRNLAGRQALREPVPISHDQHLPSHILDYDGNKPRPGTVCPLQESQIACKCLVVLHDTYGCLVGIYLEPRRLRGQ